MYRHSLLCTYCTNSRSRIADGGRGAPVPENGGSDRPTACCGWVLGNLKVRRRARCWCAKCRQCACTSSALTAAEAYRSGLGPGMQRFYALNPAARLRPCADAVVMASVGPFGFTAAAWSGLWPECRAKCITRYGYAMTCQRLTIVC